ncbi:MAG: alpha/beta hydrolase [Bryobacterales bacterium]|nr:alpha/beta hydrolase [Bryobacterales bacterium]
MILPVALLCAAMASAQISGVKIVNDIAYREGSAAWKLDLAMPDTPSATPRPAVVVIHGGGWRNGDKRTGMWKDLPIEFAKQGYVSVSLNYRFVTEARLPACIEDVKCAVRWLRAHAKDYNVDPNRIGAYGNSAGAHLAAMLALAGPNAKLEGDGPYREHSSAVQAAVISATPVDFLDWGAPRAGTGNWDNLFGGPPETVMERARNSMPLTYVHAGAPPMLIVHGNADKTVPISQSEKLARALKQAGARNFMFLIVDGAGHNAFAEGGSVTRGAMLAFFDRHLRPK